MTSIDLVLLVRATMDSLFGFDFNPRDYLDFFVEKQGVFVTLKTYPEGDLRGCIGYAMPYLPLAEAVIKSSKAAALKDSRFPSMRKEELDKIVVEVSVLSVPKLLHCSVEERIDNIKIGRDGLIIDYLGHQGLLLPQVAIEYDWDVEKFLKQLARKAGLPPESIFSIDANISTFQAEIFSEESPRGAIAKKF